MSRLTHLCLGASAGLLLLMVGLLWMPGQALAAPAVQGYGPSGQAGLSGQGGQGCPTIHKIAVGENLTVIAASYAVSVEALVEENGIADANLIVEGQSLCIPARSGPGVAEWGSYGVPGQSYDPSLVKKQASHGPQENDYGLDAKSETSRPYMVPGKSYDPSVWSKPEGYANDAYGQPESSWGVPGKSYDPQHMPKDVKEKSWEHVRIFPVYTPRVTEEVVDEPEDPGVPNGENGENGEDID